MTPVTYRNTVLQAHRFTAKEALDHSLVDAIAPGNEVLDQAKALAQQWAHKAKSGIVYKQLKDEMYQDVIHRLSVPYHRLAPKM